MMLFLGQNLLNACERIPTIGTQLRILSTVKATMLGSQSKYARLLSVVCPSSPVSAWISEMKRFVSRDDNT
jgi:hypothetical protein